MIVIEQELCGSLSREEQVELVDRMRNGDREAGDALVRSVLPMINGQISQAIKRHGISDRDEFVSEVWWMFTQSLRKFDPKVSSLTTYSHRIVRWAVLHQFKKAKSPSRVKRESLDGVDMIDNSADDDDGYEFPISIAEMRILIKRLPKMWQEVIDLRLAGHATREIAEIYGWSRVRPCQIIKKAIDRIRSWID